MGRRGQSSRRTGSSGNRGGRGQRASSRGGSSSNMGMMMGALGLVVVVIAAFMLMGSDDAGEKKRPSKNTKTEVVAKKKSNLDVPRAEPEPVGNPRSRARAKRSFDMAKLRPLKARVNMEDWKKIDALLSEAYKLKRKALDARKAGDETGFKKLITQAVDTWRKGYIESENFEYEVKGLHRDLWDACFKKEQKRIENSLQAFRAYIGYESK